MCKIRLIWRRGASASPLALPPYSTLACPWMSWRPVSAPRRILYSKCTCTCTHTHTRARTYVRTLIFTFIYRHLWGGGVAESSCLLPLGATEATGCCGGGGNGGGKICRAESSEMAHNRLAMDQFRVFAFEYLYVRVCTFFSLPFTSFTCAYTHTLLISGTVCYFHG